MCVDPFRLAASTHLSCEYQLALWSSVKMCVLKFRLVKAQNPKSLQAPLRAEFMSSDFSATAGPSAHSLLEKIFLLNILFMIFSQRKGYNAGLNFHKQWGCGWFLLPSETNHLIKNKWADRINAGHFQCGDMSLQREQQQPVNTIATRMQREAVAESTSSLMNYLSHPRVALWILWRCGKKSSITGVDYLSTPKKW